MKQFRWVRWLMLGMGAAMCAATIAVADATTQSGFAVGYLAWQRGDMQSAIQSLQAAESGVLADYALFYLGQAQLDRHDQEGAAASFTRLSLRYPESVFAARAELALANIALDRNQAAQARQHALAAIDRSDQGWVQAPARLALAQALLDLGQTSSAFEQIQELRRNYPHSSADARARALEKSLLRAHPEVADTSSLAYLSNEADLLLSEGQADDAYSAAAAALALQPVRP